MSVVAYTFTGFKGIPDINVGSSFFFFNTIFSICEILRTSLYEIKFKQLVVLF